MTPAQPQTVKQSLNKAYRLIKPKRASMEAFKANLIHLLQGIDEKESEENVKIQLMDFLKNTFYHPDYLVATKGKTDLVIHTGKEAKTPAGVLVEVKRPTNKGDMVSKTNLNAKALHELMLYYLRERLDGHNTDMRQLVITNIYEWFIFDAQDFERLFGKSTQLKKDYEAWKTGQKVSPNTDHFYKEIARPFLDNLPEELPFTYFNIKDFEKALRNKDQQDDNQLIGLYKILSPVHLLKLPFSNDSNSLDKGFYSELLHLIGLEEVKEGNKKLIQRKAPARRQAGSLLENAILTIESEDRLRKLNPPSAYGSTEEERLFTVALELCITWVNRILFLKLLEAQLIKYHRGSAHYKFLNYATIPQYDELNKLFFQVLARRPASRTGAIQQKYGHVPYLNSSLFEPTDLEDDIIRVNSLDDMVELDLHPNTVLRDAKNKPVAASLNALEYLLRFLDAYDFASEGREEIQEESKTLINAAVLGLIFEKINGYKDGSIYTPGFITMYMCRQAIRLAVLQKFNDTYNWQAETLDDLKNYLADHRSTAKILEFNALLNSLHLCDPAVGSGHFLVSALNEIIAIKAELKLLADHKGVRLANHEVSIENDELIITNQDTQDIFEYTVSPAAPGKPFYVAPETQRVQQTLFHEKQTIIENCLFGVDINPNSVKICRLRLWIELLKNAYYILEPTNQAAKTVTSGKAENSPFEGGRGMSNKSPVCYADTPDVRPEFAQTNTEQSPLGGGWGRTNEPELQTLPNIDINIKQGNSLLSRFALDTDLKEALKGTKYTVAQYRSFVQEYKTSHNKDRKRELETIINGIKADFRTEIYRNDPKVKRLQKLSGELQVLTTQTSIFEPSAKEKKARKQQQQKLEADIAVLSAGIEEIKSNAIYRNAFEWRFEFPEVLDNDGNFAGFDVVIGNPPWGAEMDNSSLQIIKNQNFDIIIRMIDSFMFFINKSFALKKSIGLISMIIPDVILYQVDNKALRNKILTDGQLLEVINLGDNIFQDVARASAILLIGSSKTNKTLAGKYRKKNLDSINDINFQIVETDLFKSLPYYLFATENISGYNLLRRLSQAKLEDYLDESGIQRGVSPDFKDAFVVDEEIVNINNLEKEKIKVTVTGGVDVKKYIAGNKSKRIIYTSAKDKPEEIPFIIEYLKPFEKKITCKEVKEGKHPFYSLHRVREEKIFTKASKIIGVITGDRIITAIDEEQIYPTDGLYVLCGDESVNNKFLVALLNSKFITYLYRLFSLEEGRVLAQIKPSILTEIPVPTISQAQQLPFINKVDQILAAKHVNLQADTTALEKQIDELVYQLYELTEEEIAIVEGE